MEEKNSVKIKYVFDKMYNPKYSNGVYGGLTPSGELEMCFYYERTSIPYEVEQELDDEGQLAEIIKTKPEERKIIRFVNDGVSMNRSSALSFYHWLQDRLIELGVDRDELTNNGDEEFE